VKGSSYWCCLARPVAFTMSRTLPDRLMTARLVLREPRLVDAAGLFESYTQDVNVPRYMTWRPHTDVSQTDTFIRECIRVWASGDRQSYVLTDRENEQVPVGMIDARIRGHIVETGYVITRSRWGQGLMPEAIRAVAEAALAKPTIFRVQATCDVENRASARALEKSGFIREARLERWMVHPNVSAEPRASFMYARCK
jgi:RimJ/RimL family protein N-acetyltransferase